MKKLFLIVATIATNMAVMADVDFQYNLKAGDKLADGTTEISAEDKVKVPAGEVMAQGTNFTVKNMYEVEYKAVGVMADTAYSHIDINGTEVDFTTNRVQGQTNPGKVDGLTMPNGSGACYELDVTKDGKFIVFVKATRNKSQFVFENVTGAVGTYVATPIQFRYNFMSNNTSGKFFGKVDGTDGLAEVFFKGDEGGELHQAPGTPAAMYANSGYGIDGCGFMMFDVLKDYSPYVFGTWGSKMMAAGFAFIPAEEVNGLSIVAKGSKGVGEGLVDYSDVTLWPAAEEVVSDLSVEPKYFNITATMPEKWMNDTVAAHGYDSTSTTKKKVWAYIWVDGESGTFYEMTAKKNDAGEQTGVFTYTYASAVAEKINVIFVNGKNWDGDSNQTVDVTNLEPGDHCFVVKAQDNAKAIVEGCGTGLENVENLKASAKKMLINGHLFLKANDMIFNANGKKIR
ncbi:MAG: hypothetical protein MJZ65_02755 [Paludibacteraceae bacterium]|nr:hypothetical protein [Paludibacteraceae bacterium]